MNCEQCQVCRHKFEPNLPPINQLFLGVTEGCNSRCVYCFCHHNTKSMDYRTAFDGLNWLAKQSDNNIVINYFGGEPLLKWNDIIVPLTLYGKHTYNSKINFNMTTNALLLDEEKLKFMKEFGISILLSFDGCKSCQDYNRPLFDKTSSSFDIVAPKIPMILKYNPNITMRMTLHNETVQYYYENHKFAVEQGFKNTFAAINTFADWTDYQFSILEEQMYKVADLYIDLFKRGQEVQFNPLLRQLNNIRTLENNPCITREKYFSKMGVGYGRCGIGANGCVLLSPDRKFYTCQETFTIPEVKDYFYVGGLDEGLYNKRRFHIASSFSPMKVKRADGLSCEECPLNGICSGGCNARNYEHNKDLNITPVTMCKHDQLTYKVGLYIKEQLQDNEIFKKKYTNTPMQQPQNSNINNINPPTLRFK